MLIVAPTTRLWTVLVYMAGETSIHVGGMGSLRETKRVGSSAGINIVAQTDRATGRISKRYHLRRDGLASLSFCLCRSPSQGAPLPGP